jgi:hypothetical protein
MYKLCLMSSFYLNTILSFYIILCCGHMLGVYYNSNNVLFCSVVMDESLDTFYEEDENAEICAADDPSWQPSLNVSLV